MCTIAPLSDYSAIVVSAGASGLAWARVEGDQWVEQGKVDPRPSVIHPRFRFRPSGGLWLAWSDRRWMHVSSYRNGTWERGDSVKCARTDGSVSAPGWLDASRDTAERPLLAWGDFGFNGRAVGALAFPSETGWAWGDEIPGSENIFTTPSVARDRNGDAWLVWMKNREGGNIFTHTYNKALSSTPKILNSGPSRVVSWALSESAPETWWAVLRARPGQSFQEVARVRAGQDVHMTWTDTAAPPGALLYKIRRESVDVRYQWESAVGSWPPPRFGPYLPVRDPLVIGVGPRGFDLTTLVFSGAPEGALSIELFDLQGRLVHRESIRATGSGRDTFELRPGSLAQPLPPGIYFARATDSLQRISNAAKVLVLR
jgi:hypothetical protein